MNFFSDAGIMEITVCHALACYLTMGCGNSRMTPGHHWMFQDLARNLDTAAGMLTKNVREGIVDRVLRIKRVKRIVLFDDCCD